MIINMELFPDLSLLISPPTFFYPHLCARFSSASENPDAFYQITILGIKSVSRVCLQSPFPSLSLEAHCSPSTEEKKMEQRVEELAWESVCVSFNIWFKVAVRTLKLCTPHLALCDHHIYLCNFICTVPSLHSAMIMAPQLRQQLQWDKLWFSPPSTFHVLILNLLP